MNLLISQVGYNLCNRVLKEYSMIDAKVSGCEQNVLQLLNYILNILKPLKTFILW